MTKRTKGARAAPRLDEEDDDLPPDDEDDDETPDDVLHVLRQLGADVSRVAIFRRAERGGKMAYVETMAADQFDLDDIKTRRGGGTYQARFHASTGKVMKSKDFTIDGPPTADADPASGNGGSEWTLQRILDVGVPLALPLLLQRLLERPASGADPMQLAVKISETMNAGNAAMMERLEKMLHRTERGDGEGLMETFLRGLEMGKELREGDDPAMRLGERALDLLQRGATSKPPPPQLPPTTTRSAAPPPPKGLDVTSDSPLAQWAPYVSTLLKWAAEGRDPGVYSFVLLDEMAQHLHPQARAFAARPDAVELVTAAVPPLGQYSEWLVDFFAGVVDAIPDPTGGTRDANDISDDAGDGAPVGGDRPAPAAS